MPSELHRITWERTSRHRPPLCADGISPLLWLYDEDGIDVVLLGVYRRFQEEPRGPLVGEFRDLYGRVLLPSHWTPRTAHTSPPPPVLKPQGRGDS